MNKKIISADIWEPVKKVVKKPKKLSRFCTELIIPNDLLTEKIFALTEPQRAALAAGETGYIVERKAGKKSTLVKTYFSMKSKVAAPLNQFDRAVLSAMISHWKRGIKTVTANMIYRLICGKVDSDKSRSYARENMQKAITESLYKLAHTRLSVDMTELCDNMKYNIPEPKFERVLLNCGRDKATLGDNWCPAFCLNDNSPLYDIAAAKNQLLTCEHSLLDVPNQHNSPELVGMKFYVLQRILETQAHSKNTTPSVTFDDLFEKCHLEDLHRNRQNNLKQCVIDFVAYLKDADVIDDYMLLKEASRAAAGNYQSLWFRHKNDRVKPVKSATSAAIF